MKWLVKRHPQNKKHHLLYGKSLRRRGRLQSALSVYKTLLERFRIQRDKKAEIAAFYKDHFFFSQAAKLYKEILFQGSSPHREGLEFLSFYYEKEGKNKDLVNLYQKALKREKNRRWRQILLNLYLREKDYRQALQVGEKLKREKMDRHLVEVLLSLYGKTGQLKREIEFRKEIKKDYDDDFDFLWDSGYAFWKADQRGEALDFFEAALEVDPRRPKKRLELAFYYLEMKKKKEARREFYSLHEKGELPPENYADLVYLYREKEDLKKAQRILEKAVADYPRHRELKLLLGEIYFQLGKREKALKIYKRLAQKNEKDWDFLLDIGKRLFWQKELSQSQKILSRVHRHSPQKLTAIKILGQIATSQGKGDSARHYFLLYLEKEESREVRFLLAELYYDLGKPQRGYYLHQKVIESFPHRPGPEEKNALRIYARSLYRTGYVDRAFSVYRRLVKAYP